MHRLCGSLAQVGDLYEKRNPFIIHIDAVFCCKLQ